MRHAVRSAVKTQGYNQQLTTISDISMGSPHIQRIPHQRRSGYGGCLIAVMLIVVVGIIGLVVLLPSLPGLVMGALGFRPVGQTAQVFLQPSAPPRIDFGAVSGSITLNTGPLGTIPLENAQTATVDGRAATVVRVTETQLNVLCRARTVLCGETPTPPLYGASIDLRPGGAIIRGMVYVAPLGLYQEAGLAVRFGGTSVTISGVDFNGTLYSLPESGLGASVSDMQRRAEDALRGITAASGTRTLTLNGIYADDSTLTLVFR